MDEYPAVLLALFSSAQIEIKTITNEFEAGRITLDEWHNEMQRIIIRYSAAAMMLGIDSEELTPEAEQLVSQHISNQMPFLDDFVADIRNGLSGRWNGEWNYRAGLYSDAIQVPFWSGSLMGIGGDWQWHYEPTAEHCNNCIELNGQVHSSEWWIQNHVPGDGRTECLMGCRCHLAPVNEAANV